MKRSWQENSLWILLRTTFEEWNADNAARLAAALAYYTIFSIAPLLVIVVALAGLFFGREAAQGQLTHEISRYVSNPDAAALIQTVIENARVPEASALATVVGFALLIWGAAGVFGELRNALNNIWDVPPRKNTRIHDFLLDRLLPIVMVIIFGALLFLSLVASTALAAAADFLDIYWSGAVPDPQVGNFLFLLLVTFIVFGLLYKYVPDVPICWADVWPGALATAILFSVGRLGIGWYLAQTSVASAYGAASSLAILLLYTYYSAQVFYLGAEFTQVYGRTYGTRRAEYQLIEQPIPATPQQTVQDASGTIVPAPNAPGVTPPDQTPPGAHAALPAAAASGSASGAPETPDASAPPVPPVVHAGAVRRRLQRLALPVAQAGAALGVIALLSVVNLVAGPLRREKKTP
jgi:membrane protein